MNTLLVTGSSGLVGSECVRHFSGLGWDVHGLDNNGRMKFFGEDADTRPNSRELKCATDYVQYEGSVSDRDYVEYIVQETTPNLVIHCAAQPSHDLAAKRPFDDFHTNATGTLNLLEAVRQHTPQAVFCFLSTNKVYGDDVNVMPFVEYKTRYDFDLFDWPGFNEIYNIDQTTHSLFGVSKTAADLYVQEYGRYFGMRTVCFRAGCLTGAAHAGTEQHGFLAYLAKCCREGRPYRIYGYKGKQVRDNLHARDVARACEAFYNRPLCGEVYNLGGGRANSVSVLEAIEMVEDVTGRKLNWEYVDEPRKGDHICWITDTSKFRSHYPEWSVTRSLADIISDLCSPTMPDAVPSHAMPTHLWAVER